MPEPEIAARFPIVLELDPGKYAWCTCGKSAGQPFCDGSHTAEGVFAPLIFTVGEKKKAAYCQCKRTGNPPYCDGTHKSLP